MRDSSTAVVSWSGGKDSTLALHRAGERGIDIVGLLTMFDPETGTSRSHGLPPGLLRDQAGCLGLPLHVGHAGWDDYEAVFKRRLGALVEGGVETAIFGDIFLDGHREWVERICAEAGCRALEPLWGESTDDLAGEALELGVDARLCTVRIDRLGAEWLGRRYDRGFSITSARWRSTPVASTASSTPLCSRGPASGSGCRWSMPRCGKAPTTPSGTCIDGAAAIGIRGTGRSW